MIRVKTMSMTIDFETEAKVRELAYARGISVSAMIRMLLRDAIRNEEVRELERKVRSAGESGILHP